MALDAGFPNADKPDSQDILPSSPLGDYREFLSQHTTPTPGEIVDLDGNVLGRHRGIEFFTVGQRRGLGINAGEPQYVISIDAEGHRIVVGPESALNQREFPGLQGQLYIRDASQWAGGRYRQGALQVQGSARSPL